MGRHPQMRRRSLTAGALAVRRMRWTRLVTLPSPGEPRGEARVSSTALPVSSPCTSGSGYGNATAPHAPTAAETGGARSAKYVRH